MGIDYDKMVSRSIALGTLTGAIGFAGGAMYNGQMLEEQGAPLSQQFGGFATGGLSAGAIGFGVGAGGYAVTSALKGILKK